MQILILFKIMLNHLTVAPAWRFPPTLQSISVDDGRQAQAVVTSAEPKMQRDSQIRVYVYHADRRFGSLQVVKFKGPVGRAVYNAVFPRSTRVDTSQLFLQGHTAFVYDLETPNSSDIPTTLRRSKADCPEVLVPPFLGIGDVRGCGCCIAGLWGPC